MTTPGAQAQGSELALPARPRIVALASSIRYKEVLLLQGSPLLGVAFTMGPLSVHKLGVLAVFALASVLLVAHIWTFNDWAGLASDRNDPNRSADVFSERGLGSGEILLFSMSLLAVSLLFFSVLSWRSFWLAAAIAGLGVFYSHPAINAKGTPVLSSSPHLIGGVLHFLLGYSLFAGIDRRGILIGLFFALTFTAGHLNQEVRDFESDRSNGLSTNAVIFGKISAFIAGFVIFTLAYADLFFLAWARIVPVVLGILPAVLYPIHVFWTAQTFRGGLSFECVSAFQGRYRLLYALIGLGMVATLFL